MSPDHAPAHPPPALANGGCLAITLRHDEQGPFVVLAGEFDLNGTDLFSTTALQLLHQQVTVIRIDTHELTFIDSSGLNSLLEIRTAAQAAGADFRLDGATGSVERVISLAGLSDTLLTNPATGSPGTVDDPI